MIERKERLEWARQAHGAYLVRTNQVGGNESALWHWYVQLKQPEAAFRLVRSDLNLRPVFHQKTQRVPAHLLVCFLALVLWRDVEQWMARQGARHMCAQVGGEIG